MAECYNVHHPEGLKGHNHDLACVAASDECARFSLLFSMGALNTAEHKTALVNC